MTKTRIQMYDKNTHTKSHTNVWKKHAYKCMKKTGIQMYEKKQAFKWMSKNPAYKIAYKCMKKTTHTNVWQKHTYKQAYKYMTKTRIKTYEKNILIYWSGGQPITAPKEYGVPCSRAPQPWQGGKQPHVQLSAHQSFCWAVSGDWTANPLVIGRPHSPLRHGQPKCKCKNVWKKQAYIYMKKKRIQMYDKNPHANIWKKYA